MGKKKLGKFPQGGGLEVEGKKSVNLDKIQLKVYVGGDFNRQKK